VDVIEETSNLAGLEEASQLKGDEDEHSYSQTKEEQEEAGEAGAGGQGPVDNHVPDGGQGLLLVRGVAEVAQSFPQPPQVPHHHRLVVGECVEAELAVVGAHPAVAHTAEGELLHREVHDCIIDEESPTAGATLEELVNLIIFREHIER